MDACPSLKLICIAATGMNNVDLDYAAEKGITGKKCGRIFNRKCCSAYLSMLVLPDGKPFPIMIEFVKEGTLCTE